MKSIRLRDFQSHRDTKIEMDGQITTIKGPTDRGKSSIIRALQWICRNSIPGDEFIREGTSKAGVRLVVATDDGEHVITRIRSASINSYALGDEEFKAFGFGVPDPIQDLLRLSELNFQSQHDPPFWLSASGGDVAKQLNAIIDLSIIDTSLSHIAIVVRRAQDEMSNCETRIEDTKKELEGLEDQKIRIEDFRKLQKKEKERDRAKESPDRLGRLLGAIRGNQAGDLRDKFLALSGIADIGALLLKRTRRMDDLSDILNHLKELRAIQPPPDFSPIIRSRNSASDRAEKAADLEVLLSLIREAAFRIERGNSRLNQATKNYHAKIQGERCPLCNQEL